MLKRLALVLVTAALTVSAEPQSCVSSPQVAIGATTIQVSAPVGTAIALTGQTASMASTTMCTNTVCPAGLYILVGYIVVTTAGTLGTVQASVTYTDDAAARSVNLGTSLSLTSTGYIPINQVVQSNGTAGITLATTLSGLGGNPQYSLYAKLIKLGGV